MKSLAVVLALLAAGGRARADDFTLPFQVPDRATGIRLVIDFEKNAKAGSWTIAVDRLQQLLDLPTDDPVVIRAKGFLPARFEGAAVVARRIFDTLPAEGRAAWEKYARTRAEELLGRGLRLRREQDLREVARRYPAADVRRRAHDALAQLALVRSDLAAAQFQLALLVDACEPADRPDALARLAWVSAQLGDNESLARVRAAGATFAGTLVTTGRDGESLAQFVDRMELVAGASAVAGRARQFGGDAHGSGVGETPPVPEQLPWSIPTGFQEGGENDYDYATMSSRDRSRISPVVPVVAHGLVFVNNGLSVTAVNLSSGTPVWRRDGTQREADWRDSFVATHTVAAADGVVYAALAVRTPSTTPADRTFYGKTILYPLPRRVLYALDERTGDVIWSHEASRLGEGREDAAEMAKECVSSPPLVVGDDVLVTTWSYEGIYDVRIVCFDRRTGRTRWRTSVVQGQQELNLFGRPVKELSTGAVAESGGRVYFSTGLGVAAAVEREDGRIAWLSAYQQTEIPRARLWYETRDRRVSWWPSPVSAAPEGVVMAPLDSDELLCFEPETGATRWKRSRTQAGMSFGWFLGVTGGRAYVTGSRAMAYDVARDGQPVWIQPDAGRLSSPKLPPAEAVSYGILTRDRLYIPTDRSIAVVSTATGALEASWPLVAPVRSTAPVTGGLVGGDGALLFVNRSQIDASYRFADLRARLETRLAQNPDDPQARLDAGEAYAAAGRLDAAIETMSGGLEHLARLAPRVRERVEAGLRRALYSAHLARAQVRGDGEDAAGAAADLRAAIDVARDKGDAVRALFALASTLSSAGQGAEADAALQRVAAEFGDVVTITSDGERAQAGALALHRLAESLLASGRTADAVERWLDLMEQRGGEDLGDTDVATAVRQRLADVARTDAAIVNAAVRTRARRAFDAAKAAGDVTQLDRASRLYPDPEVAAQSALLAAEMHIAGGRPRDAVGVLGHLLANQRVPTVTARAMWLLSTAYRAMGETARERSQLRRLAAETPNEVVDGTTTAADAAKRELAAPRFRNEVAQIADPRPPLSMLWQTGGSDQIPPQALQLAGVVPPELANRIVLTRSGVVQLVDQATGKTIWEQATRIEVRTAAAAPGAIVIAGTDSASSDRAVVVASLAISDGRELWARKRFPGQYRTAATTLGVLYLLYADAGLSSRPSYSMAAVALGTGDLLAARAFGSVLLPQIATAEDAIVVTEPTRIRDAARRALVTLDGTTLSLRGRLDLGTPSSPFTIHPPLSSVVVTSDGAALVAADIAKGDTAWRTTLSGGAGVKAVFGVTGGIIVTDDADAVRRLDAETGRETWKTSLGAAGNLVFQGEAAEGDLVVATVKPVRGTNAIAVGLDAATGAERWRVTLPLADENTYPHPEILGSVVAFELNERLERGTRSRVILLDRATGAIVQEIEHPTIGRTYERVVYFADWLAVSSANELAVYGAASRAK